MTPTKPKLRFLLSLFLVIAVLAFGSPALADDDHDDDDDDDDVELVGDEVVVSLAPSGIQQFPAIFIDYGVIEAEALFTGSSTYLFTVPTGSSSALLAQMMSDPRFEYAEPNQQLEVPEAIDAFPFWAFPFWAFPFWAFNSPGDAVPQYSDQGVVDALNLATLHAVADGENVTVAVIDTGIDSLHPLLESRLASGFDTVDNDGDPTDIADGIDNDGDGYVDEAHGHGTNVAGLVALAAPAAKIMPLRALDADGTGDEFAVAKAIEWAAANGADVINLSLGTTTSSALLDDVIAGARSRGIVVVAAAGNFGTAAKVYPAANANVIGVAALDNNGTLTGFSNRGPWIDVATRGVDLVSPHPGDRMIRWEGTSAAAPIVAGMAAVVVSAINSNPAQTTQLVLDSAIGLSAQNPGNTNAVGAGMPDGAQLAALLSGLLPPPADPPVGDDLDDSADSDDNDSEDSADPDDEEGTDDD